MSQTPRNRHIYEGLITALAVGGFFIILGFVIVSTPNLIDGTFDFFSDITMEPLGGINNMFLPAPAYPAQHITVFTALMNFFLAIGILQIVILALRLAFRSPLKRISETVGNLIFWLVGAVMANTFLLTGTLNGWFQFWSTLIILAGVSLLARFFIDLAARATRKPR
jgi:magnesium-transporting ATPase (P-type)